jgi:hypothetical protein
MIELGLLLGLGALGYVLANQSQPKESFEMPFLSSVGATIRPAKVEDEPTFDGHSNEVPFFGPRVTQSMYSGATEGVMDNHTGAGKQYFQKREVKSMFDTKAGTGNPFGNAVETDFMQSRMVTGQRMNNTFPIDQVQVGPGVNDGYTNIPRGGYQQDAMHEFALPRTTDELRVATKPKLSYEPPVIQGSAVVTQPGIQADVKKNKPDRFAVYGMDRANTAVGVQTAPRIYADQPMKLQDRESTSVFHMTPHGSGVTTFTSYIRAFTEPYQEFMRLTAQGRAGPAGSSGVGASIGADQYSAQKKFDMDSILVSATRLNVPQQYITPGSDQLGSFRYNAPLQEDIHMERNGNGILSAFHSNPYTQKLNSI